jgi:hypothetical protein
MKPLIWKEVRENLKWAVVPSLLVLLPMTLLGFPGDEPPAGMALLPFHGICALFGAGLGFVQVFFEAHGDSDRAVYDTKFYPSPTMMCPTRCDYLAICKTMDAGLDHERVIQFNYRHKPETDFDAVHPD